MSHFDSSFSSFSNVVTTSEDRRNNEKNTSNSSAMEVNSNESVTITSPTKSDITDKSGIIIGEQMKLNFFNSLKQRGFDTICLLNGNDADIFDFIQVSFELFYIFIVFEKDFFFFHELTLVNKHCICEVFLFMNWCNLYSQVGL